MLRFKPLLPGSEDLHEQLGRATAAGVFDACSGLFYRGPKESINTKISHSGSEPNLRGTPEVMLCRILRLV